MEIISRKLGEVTVNTHLSATGAGTYCQCPRKYYWQREQRWEWKGPTQVNAMSLGSMTHWFIETGLRYMLEHENFSAQHFASTALHNANEQVDSYIASNYESDISQGKAYDEQLPYARQMALNLFSWMETTKFWERYQLVSLEEEYRLDQDTYYYCIPEAPEVSHWHDYVARPDLVVRDSITGVLGVYDFKTSATLNQPVMASDWQMRVSSLVVDCLEEGDVAMGGHIRIKKVKDMKRAKPPYVELHEQRWDPKRFALIGEELAYLSSKILNDRVWLPNPTWTCQSGCGYYDACEAKSSNQDWDYVIRLTHERNT